MSLLSDLQKWVFKAHSLRDSMEKYSSRYKNMLTNRRMLKPDMEKITVVKQV